MRERLLGIFMLALSGFLGYLCIYAPLQAAANHDPEVSLSLKGSAFFPLFLGMGLVYLILGSHVTPLFGTRAHPTPLAYVFGIALTLAGVVFYFFLKSAVEAQGYRF